MRSTFPWARTQIRLEEPDDDAVALHPVEQRDVDRHVLVRRRDDLVALLQGQAVDDGVDALGGAADEGEIFLAAGGPSRRARRSLTLHQSSSSCPALGARSSVRVHSQKLFSTGSGQEPRPPKFRYDQPGSSTNWSRTTFQNAASLSADASWSGRSKSGRSRWTGDGQAADDGRHALEEFLPVHLSTFGLGDGFVTCERQPFASA